MHACFLEGVERCGGPHQCRPALIHDYMTTRYPHITTQASGGRGGGGGQGGGPGQDGRSQRSAAHSSPPPHSWPSLPDLALCLISLLPCHVHMSRM